MEDFEDKARWKVAYARWKKEYYDSLSFWGKIRCKFHRLRGSIILWRYRRAFARKKLPGQKLN